MLERRLVLLRWRMLGRLRLLPLGHLRQRLRGSGVHEHELHGLSRGHGRVRGQRVVAVRLLRLQRGQLQRRQQLDLRPVRDGNSLIGGGISVFDDISMSRRCVLFLRSATRHYCCVFVSLQKFQFMSVCFC